MTLVLVGGGGAGATAVGGGVEAAFVGAGGILVGDDARGLDEAPGCMDFDRAVLRADRIVRFGAFSR